MSRSQVCSLIGGLALTVLLAACSAPTGGNAPKISQYQSVAVVAVASFFSDQIFGSRAEGLRQNMSRPSETHWQTNEVARMRIVQDLAAANIKAQEISSANLMAPPDASKKNEQTIVSEISQSLSSGGAEPTADLHIILYPVALDRYGRPARPFAYFVAWGPLGLLSQASEEFRLGYEVHITAGMERTISGPSSCLVAYSIYLVDAKTHAIVGRESEVLARGELPRDIWPADYESLAPDEQQTLKATCLGALTGSVAQSLVKLGLITR